MAKKRASVQKREREILKRQRELKKARKAEEKRERRLNPQDGVEEQVIDPRDCYVVDEEQEDAGVGR